MSEQHFLSPAGAADVFGPLQGHERPMWRGRCGVAEYGFDEAASLPRWALPETTDVLVTDHRVLYAYTAEDGRQVRSGELRWLWPQHLRVQPGARSTDRGAAATQIQLVCGGADGTFPALVFAGGDLATVGDADRLANVIRQAIARFRVDNVDKLGLTAGQGRMLSRLLIGPEFRNHQGGEGQTVSLLGALLVNRPVAAPALAALALDAPALDAPALNAPDVGVEPPTAEVVTGSLLDEPLLDLFPADPPPRGFAADALPRGFAAGPPPHGEDRSIAEGTRLIAYRPGRAEDAARALMAAKAEEATQQSEPATASRAADLAAQIASLVSRSAEPEPGSSTLQDPQQFQARLTDLPTDDHRSFGARLSEKQSVDAGRPEDAGSPEHAAWSRGPWQSEPQPAQPQPAKPQSAQPQSAEQVAAERSEMPTANLTQRAESMRRAAARMAANAARGRASERRGDREPGISTRGYRNG